MNKFWMAVIGIVAAIVLLSNLGSLLGLAMSVLILYAGVHYYLKSTSTAAKCWWIFVGLIGLVASISNVPAFIALIAAVVLWMIYRKWHGQNVSIRRTNDPFSNFEKQWKQLTK